MSGDQMQRLRRALYGGDGAAMVAAVDAVGLEYCLQLAGELVRAIVQRRVDGAHALAHACGDAARAELAW